MTRTVSLILLCFSTLNIFIGNSLAADLSWGEKKDKHFVIYYESKSDKSVAEKLLRQAEHYYRKIGDDIGYSRTNRMWTWDNRVEIFLFATQATFIAKTGQPVWSTGYADRDSRLFNSRTIITYTQENNFADGLLPHEISHLILHDFISIPGNIPIWFDEGVAQLQENDKRSIVRRAMASLVKQNLYVPFDQIAHWDIRRESDPRKAQIFYAQSLAMIDFLVTRYGVDAFAKLCRAMREHQQFEAALSSAYPGIFKDYIDLERKWVQSFN